MRQSVGRLQGLLLGKTSYKTISMKLYIFFNKGNTYYA